MLFASTPLGPMQVPDWLEKDLEPLSDEQLLQKAKEEDTAFVIAPATFALIEKRGLLYRLQKMVHLSVTNPVPHPKTFSPNGPS